MRQGYYNEPTKKRRKVSAKRMKEEIHEFFCENHLSDKFLDFAVEYIQLLKNCGMDGQKLLRVAMLLSIMKWESVVAEECDYDEAKAVCALCLICGKCSKCPLHDLSTDCCVEYKAYFSIEVVPYYIGDTGRHDEINKAAKLMLIRLKKLFRKTFKERI